jgi:hypothetical protein
MTQADQAALLWPILAFAAQMQRVLTYSELAGFTGVRRLDAAFSSARLALRHDRLTPHSPAQHQPIV